MSVVHQWIRTRAMREKWLYLRMQTQLVQSVKRYLAIQEEADAAAALIDSLEKTNKEIVYITEEQKGRFAGNMLQVQNATGDKFVVMSHAAFTSLTEEQKEQLSKHGQLLHSSLDTIEALGGGSARCMMAEVFLPKK